MLATVVALALAVAQTGPEVTIYNQGFGLVKEARTMDLKAGRQTVAVEDVASMIEPSSVSIRSLTDKDSFTVLEQNYQYDLISPLAILNKSVGQKVRFVRSIGNQRDVLEGTLISSPTAIVGGTDGSASMTYNGMVIRTDDGRIVLNPTGEVEVQTVPPGLISRPTLLWEIDSARAGSNTVELSYLTKGISWKADYVLTLDGTASHGDLQSWVTLDNQSGKTYPDAKLKLLAGDVNRAPTGQGGFGGGLNRDFAAAKAPQFQEESLFEYHLYTLQRPTTVADKSSKQVSLLQAPSVAVSKKLILDAMQGFSDYYPAEGEVGTGDLKPQVRIEFENTLANGLGVPLPMGDFKVYQRDASGSVQLLGEDHINHTPKNEHLSLVVGRSFDIAASRKRTNFTRINNRTVSESFEIEVRNRKEVPDTVHVYERHWGDWHVTKKSQDFVKLDANTMDFVVSLKPNEVRTVSYTVETRW